MTSLPLLKLLDRDALQTDPAGWAPMVVGKTLVITGAGGSIGSVLVRQASSVGASRLVLLEQSEEKLFWIDRELRGVARAEVQVVPVLGSVCDETLVGRLCQDEAPDLLIHAAACKHVGLAELNPVAAIRANVLGTYTVASAAISNDVPCLLNVSTDKAVEPISVLGMTKRASELVVTAVGGQAGQASVRFGNVLGSSGSLLEIMRADWRRSRRIEVRDRSATRFFLTPEEAGNLIFTVAGMVDLGDLFVIDSGAPTRILDVAKRYLQLQGCKDPDSKIDVTELLPGEKREELLWAGQTPAATNHPNVGRLRESFPDPGQLGGLVRDLTAACDAYDVANALAGLRRIIGLTA